ncbi:hypothetical protein [Ramlibacter albus]|uniref:Uncharacterized protein n=1 Tax=Ramlibacter albus TaxID=2079448 RepID=A0A923MAY6_9BURK|nr:hypothetical protein [Ramlibacter albus]MBC5766166.1 hypothetical protein [Ramlibacter albus]
MVIIKTLQGHRVLKDRSVPLTPRQRSAFILVDGKKTTDEILAATKAGGVTQADIDKLVELGLVEELSKSAAMHLAMEQKLQAKRSGRTPEQRFEEAWPYASMLTSSLGLMGYRLNNAVENATTYMDLLALAPKIREAVGPERFEMLDRLLND